MNNCNKNFSREGKPTLKLSVFHNQVFLGFDTYNTDAIAINKPCKLNFTVLYNVLSYELAAGLSGHFFSMDMVCY